MISLSAVVNTVVYLVITGLIFSLLCWLIQHSNAPEPFRKIANVVLAILAVVVIIGILLALLGGVPVFRP